MQPPETRFTNLGDVNIAYQVLGQGPDLMMVPLFASHLDLMWTDAGIEGLLRHLSSFSRLILFDMPGTGLSDRLSRVPTLDERVDFMATVLDAVGSERVVLCGTSEGGQASMLFTATHPGRVDALILYSTFPNWPSTDELGEMLAEVDDTAGLHRIVELARHAEHIGRAMDEVAEHWGEGRSIDLVAAPPHSRLEQRFWAVFERAAMSRGAARAALKALREFNVKDVLPTIRVPTLVLHPTNDLVVPVEIGRYIAQRIDGANFVETSGAHHGFGFGDIATVAREVERFVTGASHLWDPDRAFGTVLFTDIVGSTQRAAEMGDQRWRELLQHHNTVVHERVDASSGHVVKQTGDGFLIHFDRSADAIRCAQSICTATREVGVQIRAGLHSGECELVRDDLAGLAVHIGARVAALAKPGEVLVSSTVKDLVVGSGIEFEDRGRHRLKGVPNDWQLFAVQPSTTQREQSELRPTPADHLTRRDRVALRFVERAPGLARSAGRVLRSSRARRAERSALGTR